MPVYRFEISSDPNERSSETEHEFDSVLDATNAAVNAISQFVGNSVPPSSLLDVNIYTEDGTLLAEIANRFEVRLVRKLLS